MKKLITLMSFSILYFYAAGQDDKNLTNYIVQPGPEEGFDTEIYSCSAYSYDTMNFGTRPELTAIAWTRNGEISNVRSLIYFNMPSFSFPVVIDSAFLNLYASPNSLEGQHWSLSGPNTTVLQMVTSPWQENIVTWLSQPSTTTANQIFLGQTSSVTDNFRINITNFVSQWISNPSSNYGMEFKLQDETYYRKVVFASSDHSISNIRPKLEIYYSPASSINDSDTNNFYMFPNPIQNNSVFNLQLKYPMDNFSVIIVDLAGKTLFSSDFQNSTFVQIPISSLSSGIYTVMVKSDDGFVINKKLVINN